MRYISQTLVVSLSASMSMFSLAFESAQAQEARGLVRSATRIEIRTDLLAPVSAAPFLAGMKFNVGDELIRFDCSKYRAELNSARASANAAAIELRNKKRLHTHGAAGKSEVQLAKAEAERANAEVKVRRVRVEQCTIQAPFSGRVVSLNTRVHEMPNQSDPVIVLLDDSRLELELVVPSKWLVWLKAKRRFVFHVDETGKAHNAEIDRLGAEVDPVSQTIKAYGSLLQSRGDVLAGMSGRAEFAVVGN